MAGVPITPPTPSGGSLTGTTNPNAPVSFSGGGGVLPDGSATNDPVVWQRWLTQYQGTNTGSMAGGGSADIAIGGDASSATAAVTPTTVRLDPGPTPISDLQIAGSTTTPPTESQALGQTPTTATPTSPTTSNPQPVNPNQTSLTAQQANALLQQLISSTGTQNPLNSFWQVAYHWRLMIVNDQDIYATSQPSKVTDLYSKIDSLNPIVIVETGATTYNIKSVEMRALVGPNFESRNINTVNFNIHIVEPMGVGFLDALKESALTAGIRNLQKCPYYLELSFKAYDESTGNIVNPLSNAGLDATRWIWQIQIVDIETQFDAGGGQYTMTAQVYNDSAYEQDILTVPQTTNMTGGTIKDILTSLGKNLTSSWKDRYGNDDTTYDFIMHKIANPTQSVGSNTDPNTYKMKSQNPNYSSIRLDNPANGQFQAIMAPGTGFNDMVEWIFMNNDNTQNLGLDRENIKAATDASTSSTNNKKVRESIIFRLETDIELTTYDTINAQYRKLVHVHIWPFYTQAMIGSPTQRDDAKDPNVQSTMVTKLLQNGFLKKHYDYLYTGLNTEVLDFQIRSNFKWNALLPKLIGTQSGNENTTQHSLINATNNPTGNRSEAPGLTAKANTVAQINTLKAANQTLISQLQQVNTQLTPVNAAITAAQTTLGDPNSTAEEKAAAQAALNTALPQQNSLVSQQQSISANTINIQQRVDQLTTQNLQSAQSSLPRARYAEDLVTANNMTNASNYDYEAFNYSVSFRQGYRDVAQAAGTGVIGDFTRDRSVFGSLIEQLYQPYTLQLANIDLSIRGDPFWIGASNLQRQVYLRKGDAGAPNAGTQSIMKGLPNWLAGDQTFLITFRYPILINDSNQPVFRSDDTFNGIYRATEVTSTFSDGIFRQKIHGIILPLINVDAAFGNIKNLASGQSAASSGGNSGNSGSSSSNPNGSSSPSNVSPTLTTVQQQQNAQQFATALNNAAMAQGITLSSDQIDGIVANAYRESSMNPTLSETDSNGLTSAGLLQWNGDRYNSFTNTVGVPPNQATIEQQANYAITELTSSPSALNGTGQSNVLAPLQATTNATDAANVWITQYERPANSTTGQSINQKYLPNLYGTGQGSSASFLNSGS